MFRWTANPVNSTGWPDKKGEDVRDGSVRAGQQGATVIHELERIQIARGRRALYAYNVTRVVDALDEEQSVITRFQSSGRVMEINTYAFHRGRVEGLTVFKIPQHIRLPVLVTTAFVDAVTRHKLTGFRFGLVWSESGR